MPRNRVILLTRAIGSTAVLSVHQLDGFRSQKGKGPGTQQFPSAPIMSGCSSESVSYRREQKWAIEEKYCMGLHSAFTFATVRAFHLQSCSLPFSPNSGISHQNSHNRVIHSLWGSIFYLFFLRCCSHDFAFVPVLGHIPPWKQLPLVWELPPLPSFYLPLILFVLFTLTQKQIFVDNRYLSTKYATSFSCRVTHACSSLLLHILWLMGSLRLAQRQGRKPSHLWLQDWEKRMEQDEILGTVVHGLAVVAKTPSVALGQQESVSVHWHSQDNSLSLANRIKIQQWISALTFFFHCRRSLSTACKRRQLRKPHWGNKRKSG